MLPLLFAMVIGEVMANARKGWIKQILYAGDLDLIGKIMEELRENFDEWREAFESKDMTANLGKTKLIVSGMEEVMFARRLIFVACGEQESCPSWCYVQHVVNGSTHITQIRKLQFI